MSKIAFLGLGLMGRGMAQNLLRAGHDVTVWNRSADKMQPLMDAGARAAANPAQAVDGAAFIITILGDDAASESVWLGKDGVLSGDFLPGAIAIESTTVSHAWMKTLGQKCIDLGLRFLDCPVTGGPHGAENRQLTMLVGGHAETLADATPVLNAYAKRIYHFGPVGAGTSYKLIVNSIGAVQAAAVAEGMAVADAAGLPLELVAEALGSGSVASSVTTYIAPCMAAGEHEKVRFAAKWRGKDVHYGHEMAQALGCTVPVFSATEALFREAIHAGLGELNESVISRLIRRD